MKREVAVYGRKARTILQDRALSGMRRLETTLWWAEIAKRKKVIAISNAMVAMELVRLWETIVVGTFVEIFRDKME